MDFREQIQSFAEQPINGQILLDILKDYKRPHDKIDGLEKQGLLIQVKRGLYVPGPKLHVLPPELFLVANHLYGPSYISLDAALSYWGLIPEKVFEISSVTIKAKKKYITAIGRFTYTPLPLPYYSFGIKQVQLTKKQTVLMASVEKALCDKIISTKGILLRSVKQTAELLLEDFRMDAAMLRSLNSSMIGTWLSATTKQKSLAVLIKTLKII